jgi:hypothetical protein
MYYGKGGIYDRLYNFNQFSNKGKKKQPKTASVVVNTALNQQSGKTQSQGMRTGGGSSAASTLLGLKKQRIASAASTQTKKPKTIPQVLQKMEANQVTPALPKVVAAASSTVIREIKKGADPVLAYRALRSEPAIILANCKEMFSQIPASQQRSWGMVRKSYGQELGKIKLTEQQILMLDKEVRLLALQNSPDVLLKAQSALGSAQTQQANDIAILSDKASQYAAKRGIHHDLIGCLIGTARAEGALAFEASIGSEIKTPEQELEEEQMKTPEEIVEETEGAAILLQAAEEDADASDPSIAETPSDKAVAQISKGMNYEEYLTPKNLLIGGLALGAIYMVFIKD